MCHGLAVGEKVGVGLLLGEWLVSTCIGGTPAGKTLVFGPTGCVGSDMSANTPAIATSPTSGGTNSIGCQRAAAAPLRVVVRTRSAAIAMAICTAGSAGPRPMRALLRALMIAACRCAGVSPGCR